MTKGNEVYNAKVADYSRGPYNYDACDLRNSTSPQEVVYDLDISQGKFGSIEDNLHRLPEEVQIAIGKILKSERVSYDDKLFLQKIKETINIKEGVIQRIKKLIKRILKSESSDMIELDQETKIKVLEKLQGL